MHQTGTNQFMCAATRGKTVRLCGHITDMHREQRRIRPKRIVAWWLGAPPSPRTCSCGGCYPGGERCAAAAKSERAKVMESGDVAAVEARLRKTILKAGALAGVCAVGAMLALVLVAGAVRWGINSAEENTAMNRAAAVARENAKVSPEFMEASQKIVALIRVEHTASLKSLKEFEAAHQQAELAWQQLGNLAKTPHETDIWVTLERGESGFYSCARNALDPSIHSLSVSMCENENPLSEIDQALAHSSQ